MTFPLSILTVALLLSIGATNSLGAVDNITFFFSNGYRIGITNNTGETVNRVRKCTPLENASEITNATFLGDWSQSQYTEDWDSDGIDEICYEFNSTGTDFDMLAGQSGDIVISTTVNPQAMVSANGTVQAKGEVDGPYIFGGEAFTSAAPDPYSQIGVSVDANTSVTNNPGRVYWGESAIVNVDPVSGYQIDALTGCDSSTGDAVNGYACTVNGDGDTVLTATSSPIPVTLYILTASIVDGGGNITSSPAGIDTSIADNTEDYPSGTLVTINANPDSEYHLASWGGACAGTGTCQVTMDAPKSVSANYDINQYALNVAKDGTGTGTVTGTDIDCGADCTATLDYGTVTTLTATQDADSTFVGWQNCASPSANTCEVTVTGTENVTATFNDNVIPTTQYTLTASIVDGGGNITSSPAGIDSSIADNTELYDEGTVVTLNANPDLEHHLASWGGACAGTGACQVTMDAPKSVSANYDINQYALNVAKNGTGTGTVTGTGIDCGADCTETLNYGTITTLTATQDADSTFVGWQNCDSPGANTCEVTVTGAENVIATFNDNATPAPPATILFYLPAILAAP